MNAPADTSPDARRVRSWLRIALAVVLGLGLAAQAARVQLATRALATGRPDLALALDPKSGAAAAALAADALTAGHRPLAMQAATRALALAPLTAAAVRTMGLAAAGEGDNDAANRWMSLAGALGWRDLPTQLWLADRLAAGGVYDQALPRLDALLRHTVPRAPLFAMLDALAAEPAARRAIADRLAANPLWRADYFRAVDALDPSRAAAREALFATLATTPAPLSRAELLAYVNRLAVTGDDARGHALWLRYAADRHLLGVDGLYDGQFRAAGGDVTFPYEWFVPASAEGVVSRDVDAGGSSALAVSAAGGDAPELVRQSLLLGPGAYIFSYRSAGSGEERLTWSVQCGRGGRLLPTRAVREGDRRGLAFVVPAGPCPVIVLGAGLTDLEGSGGVELRLMDARLRRTAAG